MIIETSQLPRFRGAVAMVDGGFDPLHAGHVEYFRQARASGLPLLCNMRGDVYLRDVKGRPPLLPEQQRAEVLDALAAIDHVHVCRTSTREVLETLRPAAYVKGADWRDRLPAEEVQVCERLGIRVLFMDSVTGSSSDLVARFLADAPRAERPHSRDDGPTETERRLAAPPVPAYPVILTSHLNRYLSGVAKFNHILAERTGGVCRPMSEAAQVAAGPVLVSVKLADSSKEMHGVAERAAAALLERGIEYDLFFHSFGDMRAERRLLAGARHAFAGNEELVRRIVSAGYDAEALWCPALLDGHAPLATGRMTVFSFGMSHKIRVHHYERLKLLLDRSGADYEILVSTAFHENASFGDLDETERQFMRLFGRRVHLLGFLSDESVDHFLTRADVFCAFFEGGVRANNTTAFAALERGTPLLTNLDPLSPRWMRHGWNLLDLARTMPEDLTPERLRAVSVHGRSDAAANASWDRLVRRLADAAPPAEALAGLAAGHPQGHPPKYRTAL